MSDDNNNNDLIRTFEGHRGYVNSVAFSPDGTKIVSGSDDSTIKVWNTSSGDLIQTLEGHREYSSIHSVAFSPDGTKIVSGSSDEKIKLWDASTGDLIQTLHVAASTMFNRRDVYSVAFSPDSTTIVSGHKDGEIRLWRASTGELLLTLRGHNSSVNSVAFSPDPNGTNIVSGSGDKTIKLWDTSTGKVIQTLRAHNSRINSVAFSPDGTTIVSGSMYGRIKLWDVTTGELLQFIQGNDYSTYSTVFSPDGKKIVSGSSDKTIKLWDGSTGALIRTYEGHREYVWSVAFSPDGTKIVSGSSDKTIKLWKVAEDKQPQFYDTLVPEGVIPEVVALGRSFTLNEFKQLGPFIIEKKLIYDNYLEDEEDVGCGFELAKNIAFPVRTGPQSSQIFCVSDLVKWINMGNDKDPGNNEPITTIRVMNENDVAEQEWKDCRNMRKTLLAKIKICQNKRKGKISNDLAMKLRNEEINLRGLLNKIPATRRVLNARKIERDNLNRLVPQLKF